MTKPPRTNIDRQIKEAVGKGLDWEEVTNPDYIKKYPGTKGFWGERDGVTMDCYSLDFTVKEIKKLLLTYIKELVGEEEQSSFGALQEYPEALEKEKELRTRNQLRQEILSKAEEELG